jgi:Ankyrin repeats (3 copies)
MNDLLTAPVYKRLALSMLRRPRSLRKIRGVLPSTSNEPTAEHQTLTDKSPVSSVHESCASFTNKLAGSSATVKHRQISTLLDLVFSYGTFPSPVQNTQIPIPFHQGPPSLSIPSFQLPAAAATTNLVDTPITDLVQPLIDASSGGFSSSVVADFLRPQCHNSSASDTGFSVRSRSSIGDGMVYIPQSRWLPLLATVKRGNLTVMEQYEIDKELLDTVESGSLFEIAQALDAGADINAAILPEPCKTPLQIATTNAGCCPALKFLLSYKNVNLHVRSSVGENLLHAAVRLECEKCIQSLLDVGLSMTDKDQSGFSALNLAVESWDSTQPLLNVAEARTEQTDLG